MFYHYNRDADKISRHVEDLDKDFCDGVNLILLIGLLEGERNHSTLSPSLNFQVVVLKTSTS